MITDVFYLRFSKLFMLAAADNSESNVSHCFQDQPLHSNTKTSIGVYFQLENFPIEHSCLKYK